MTAYERGFLTKCAEYGVDGRELMKMAAGDIGYYAKNYVPDVLVGAGLGAGLGAFAGGKKKRGRGALIGALAGAGMGGGFRYLSSGKGISSYNTMRNKINRMLDRRGGTSKRFPSMRLGYGFDDTPLGQQIVPMANMFGQIPEDAIDKLPDDSYQHLLNIMENLPVQ